MRDPEEIRLITRRILESGYAPAKWSHFPKKVRDAIRRARMRPAYQMCWSNCQKLVLNGGLDCEYHEGWLITHVMPVAHCWLEVDDEIVDFTAPDGYSRIGYPLTREDVVVGILRNRGYAPIDAEHINRLSPSGHTVEDMTQLVERLERRMR